MDDADLEATRQEWAVAPAPESVIRELAAQLGDVVPPVVVHDEEAPAGTQQALRLGEVIWLVAPERRPKCHDDVGSVIGRLERGRSARRDERYPRSEIRELSSADAVNTVNENHVPSTHRAERLERSRDLAFDIEDPGEMFGEPGGQFEGEISHRPGV